MRGARSWVAAVLVALALAGPAPAPAEAASTAARLAGHELGELLGDNHGRPLAATLPDFRPVMGYVPVAARLAGTPGQARWLKPSGACSSPLGGTPFGFEAVCKSHDFGYDLLRFADRTGRPAGPELRRAVDDRFDQDLHMHCARTRRGLARFACDGMAAVYSGVVKLGSWAQGHGTP
jgi:hypothetical protein